MNLTLEQQKPAFYDGKYALVQAVAGSGKSHMLVYRIKHLVEERNVEPEGILVLMFNVSAAEMFASRLDEQDLQDVGHVYTFHSFARLLHQEYKEVVGESFFIMDDDEEKDFFRELVFEWNTKYPQNAFVSTREELFKLYQEMDLLKNMDAPETVEFPFPIENLENKLQFLYFWNQRRRKIKKMGMTDLLYDLVYKCKKNPAFLQHVRSFFTHVFVDEYQDSNALQQWLLTSFCNKDTDLELMCVGDEDQCIYAFRGSDPNYMSKMFIRDFPGAAEFTLSRTFRYGHAIALLANQSIAENEQRTVKWCVSGHDSKTSQVSLTPSDSHGSEIMAAFLKGQLRGATILVRSHHHGDDIELAFWRQGYKIHAAKSFWERGAGKFIKLMLDFNRDVKSAIADYDALHFLLKWVYPHADKKLTEYGIKILTGGPLYYRLQNAQSSKDMDSGLRKPFIIMEEIVAAFHGKNGKVKTISDIVDVLMQYRNSQTLPLWMTEFNQWHEPLEWLREQLSKELTDSDIVLTTIHQSKGQGYHFVILPHVEKGMFPALRSNMEEERRLFYVAVTRAETKLWVLTSDVEAKYSPFVNDEMFDLSQKWGDYFTYAKEVPLFGSLNKHIQHYANERGVLLEKQASWKMLKKR